MAGIGKLKSLIRNNKIVLENYFFMTILQVLNSMFYLLIYPFLIRTLGPNSYGLYVFSLSIVTYFILFVGFGFDMPAVKIIAQYPKDQKEKSYTLSCVFTAKVYLEIISLIIFAVVVISIPYLHNNWLLLFICFSQTITSIIFPQWYFQGVQRMRIVTYIQLGLKIFSLPFIFLFVHSPNDIAIFAFITSMASVCGGIVAAMILIFHEKVKISWMPISEVKKWYKDAFPFFLSTSAGIIKEQSVTLIIGAFFGMKDVAIYDLANKIIMVPRTLLMSVNGALFPKIMANIRIGIIKKIIRYETIIGFMVIVSIAFFGKWIVSFMGGSTMADSYPLAVVLSITVLSWIVVGSYISFVFVPKGHYYFVTKNQIVAFVSFFLYCGVGLFFVQNAFVLVTALSLSGLTEIAFCKYLIKKERLL